MRHLFLTALLITSCAYEVRGHQLKEAEKFCETHGGVDFIRSATNQGHINAHCVDGTFSTEIYEYKAAK